MFNGMMDNTLRNEDHLCVSVSNEQGCRKERGRKILIRL